MSNLYEASHQWRNRPADERFENVVDMYNACKGYANSAKIAQQNWTDLCVQEVNDDVCLVGSGGNPAKMTHYAFSQLARTIGAPADYLRSLPTPLAVQAVTHGMAQKIEMSPRQLLLHKNGNMVIRCMVSELYDWVWNFKLIEHCKPLFDAGWVVPPARPAVSDPRARPATEADILPNQCDFGLSVKVGDMIAPAGLYASDHDMFMFLVDPNRSIDIGSRSLMRGIFIRNSEVGDCSLAFKFFCMDNVCGNHICWGVSNVHEISVKHMGENTLNRALDKLEITLKKYQDNAKEDEQTLANARKFVLGASKEDVIDAIVAYAKTHSLPLLSRKRVNEAYSTAEAFEHRYGNPRTLWGVVSGLTQNSQGDYADVRSDVDIQAGKLLAMAS